MQSSSTIEPDNLFHQRPSALDPDSLNQIRAGRRAAKCSLKIKVSVVSKNNLHNLAYQRRNALIHPPGILFSTYQSIPRFSDN